jgi:hypothetical protein
MKFRRPHATVEGERLSNDSVVRYTRPLASAGKQLLPAATPPARGAATCRGRRPLVLLSLSPPKRSIISKVAPSTSTGYTAAPRWSRSRQRAVSAARRCLKAAVFLAMAPTNKFRVTSPARRAKRLNCAQSCTHAANRAKAGGKKF